MKLSVTDAAKQVGKPRSTLYRHMKAGKLSSEQDSMGNTVLDVSELQRVYGELRQDTEADATPDAVQLELLQLKLDAAQQRAATAEQHAEELREQNGKLLGIIETQTKALSGPRAPWWKVW